jgi:hypothetical protein
MAICAPRRTPQRLSTTTTTTDTTTISPVEWPQLALLVPAYQAAVEGKFLECVALLASWLSQIEEQVTINMALVP